MTVTDQLTEQAPATDVVAVLAQHFPHVDDSSDFPAEATLWCSCQSGEDTDEPIATWVEGADSPEVTAVFQLAFAEHQSAALTAAAAVPARAAAPTGDAGRAERLRTIQGRLDSASTGPWSVWRDDDDGSTWVAAPDWYRLAKISAWQGPEGDAVFISETRTDIPWLLAQVTAADTAAAHQAATLERYAALLSELVDPDPCQYDHNGGCQAHGFIFLTPGETCPHADVKALGIEGNNA